LLFGLKVAKSAKKKEKKVVVKKLYMGIKNVKLDTKFESVGKNANSSNRSIRLKSFENSNKSQKLTR
jgi:hypothetical protein